MEGAYPTAMAIFRASDLKYWGQYKMTFEDNKPDKITDAACCAVDKNGIIYMPDGIKTDGVLYSKKFIAYELDWKKLKSQIVDAKRRKDLDIVIRDFNGNQYIPGDIQGMDFSESGALLYMLCGHWQKMDPTFGIHALDVKSGRQIARSSRSQGPFFYTWQPGSPQYEEPEGICVWDLDHKNAPHISGQMHAVLLDNEGTDVYVIDEVYIKHYANRLYVNSQYGGDNRGPSGRTYTTMKEAGLKAWDGSRIGLYSGKHPGAFLINHAIQIFSVDGKAVVGQKGQIMLKPQAKINISGKGGIKAN
jgi:hypothetical protein